jgi:hypothetical protein
MHLREQQDGTSERETGEGDEAQAPGPSSCPYSPECVEKLF